MLGVPPIADPFLLLFDQDGLLPLALALLVLLVRVLPLVLFSPLDGRQLLALDLARLLDHLGQVPVAADAADLGQVRVPVHQRAVVFERLPLLGRLDTASFGRVRAPQPDITLSYGSVSNDGIGEQMAAYVVASRDEVL